MSNQQNSDKIAKIKKDIAEAVAAEKRNSRFDYGSVAFMLKRPHSHDIEKGPFRIRNRDEHRKLIDLAQKKGLYVWYGAVSKVGEKYMLTGPHLIDWDSVPDPGGPAPAAKPAAKPATKITKTVVADDDDDDETVTQVAKLVCSQCGKRCTSTSGLTLHIKHSHGS